MSKDLFQQWPLQHAVKPGLAQEHVRGLHVHI
eukprot:CAMPEP_0115281250 /NCGR_PEP_ID=MMETSP0270-20121206/59221_1 /TAXON_ID=71861 /ORGANISM="Scrippsiella trochoidea, Strain CCMP3099" /LENGTH=31 /DNA_ID= /DNA_START= /DNA_END= /DNA_ORIENTATION=